MRLIKHSNMFQLAEQWEFIITQFWKYLITFVPTEPIVIWRTSLTAKIYLFEIDMLKIMLYLKE